MSQKAVNSFTSWELSEQEVLQGSVLTDLQLKVMQNQRAEIAEQKLALIFDPLNPMSYGLRVAELDGQLGAINYILAQHEVSAASSVIESQSSQE